MEQFEGVFGQGETHPMHVNPIAIRVALYARVSTYDQQTLPLQLSALREYAARRRWGVATEAREVGSGATKRPQREELLALARRRQIDHILVWRLDRWGRSLADLVTSLTELQSLGVGFVSITEALDFTTPGGRAMAGMLAVFAEFERDILRDRVKAGVAEARKHGKPHGRPATARQKHASVSALADQGLSAAQIARDLGIGRTSVRRMLRLRANAPSSRPQT
ncbi:MAG: recombinase family protein [Phycisphaerales bacterium]|nr:recombinase family protein [Phycisphaerales bacterium]